MKIVFNVCKFRTWFAGIGFTKLYLFMKFMVVYFNIILIVIERWRISFFKVFFLLGLMSLVFINDSV